MPFFVVLSVNVTVCAYPSVENPVLFVPSTGKDAKPRSVAKKAVVVLLWSVKLVSLEELSVQVSTMFCGGVPAAASRLGAGGGTWKTIGRIMSFSS